MTESKRCADTLVESARYVVVLGTFLDTREQADRIRSLMETLQVLLESGK